MCLRSSGWKRFKLILRPSDTESLINVDSTNERSQRAKSISFSMSQEEAQHQSEEEEDYVPPGKRLITPADVMELDPEMTVLLLEDAIIDRNYFIWERRDAKLHVLTESTTSRI